MKRSYGEVLCVCLLVACNPALAAPGSRPVSVDLASAQREVLHAYWLARPAERDEALAGEVKKYVALGLPADAFTLEAMRATASAHVAQMLSSAPSGFAPLIVAHARIDYGIEPHEIAAQPPAPREDLPALFRARLSETEYEKKRMLAASMAKIPVMPQAVPGLIAAAEESGSPEAFQELLLLLGTDWSEVGLRYLYSKLATAPAETQLRILEVMRGRLQILAPEHVGFVEATEDPAARDEAFAVASLALGARSAEAVAFFRSELNSPRADNRAAALRIIGASGAPEAGDMVREAIRSAATQGDPSTRVSEIRALSDIRGTQKAEADARLLEILRSDPSLEVRLAALESIRLAPVAPELRWSNARRIEVLREAVGSDAPQALQDALAAKLAQYEQECQDLQEKVERHRESLLPLIESARAAAQTQPASSAPVR